MRVLVVSIAAPPKNDPEALQTGKYIKYLSQQVDLDLVTSSNPTLWMNYDDQLNALNKNVNQIIEVPIYEPKYLSILANKLFRKYLKPDSRSSFHKQFKKVVKQLKKQPDIIYSRSFPLSSTLMAKKLHLHYNIPWVLHLSDPWVETPVFNFKNNPYHQKEELACFKLAAVIAFTSKQVIEMYTSKYPEFEKKFIYCPNVYDPVDVIEKKEIQSTEELHLVYTGSLNGSRNLKTLIRAIKTLDSSIQKRIRITVAGSLDSENKQIIEENKNRINYLGFLPFSEVKKIQSQADILLALDFDFKSVKEAIFFPSKLLDYFAVQKPILSITNEGSTSDKILSEMGHFVAYHKDEKSVASIINAYFADDLKFDFSLPDFYAADKNATEMYNRFLKLC